MEALEFLLFLTAPGLIKMYGVLHFYTIANGFFFLPPPPQQFQEAEPVQRGTTRAAIEFDLSKTHHVVFKELASS